MAAFNPKLRNKVLEYAYPAIFRSSTAVELERVGSPYGGWWIAPSLIDESSICYLAGVGLDISFDLGLVERYGCEAWGIDPTPRSVTWVGEQRLDPKYHFVPLGLAGISGKLRFYSPRNPEHISHSITNLRHTTTYFEAEALTVKGLMEHLGHSRLDVLKLDVEGAEYDVIHSMLSDKIYPKIICLEFDQPAPVKFARQTVESLLTSGYQVAKVDKFNLTFLRLEKGTPDRQRLGRSKQPRAA